MLLGITRSDAYKTRHPKKKPADHCALAEVKEQKSLQQDPPTLFLNNRKLSSKMPRLNGVLLTAALLWFLLSSLNPIKC
jgi:hypothetical protein